MAEKMKDREDRLLESMLAAEPIADNGFSVQVVRKVRRGLWLRRLVMPCAIVIGGMFAIKPLSGLVALVTKLPAVIPSEIISGTTSALPQFSVVATGAMLLAACLLGARMLNE